MGEGKLTPLTTPTPLNQQSPNIAHVITSTISPHTPHLVKVTPGVTSPHIAKIKSLYRPRAQATFSAYGVWQGLVAPTLNFRTPSFISETNGARNLKFGMLVGICRYYGYL